MGTGEGIRARKVDKRSGGRAAAFYTGGLVRLTDLTVPHGAGLATSPPRAMYEFHEDKSGY